MVNIEFDGIIYALQKFWGASVYWGNIVDRVRLDERYRVAELRPERRSHGIPVHSHANVFHSSNFRRKVLSSTKTVTTVHDLTYELGMLNGGLKARLNFLERRRSYFGADASISISQRTMMDLLGIYPALAALSPIYVINRGLTVPDFTKQQLPVGLRENGYLLYAGGSKNYKNFALALRVFVESGIWRDGVKFVCTSRSFTEQELSTFVGRLWLYQLHDAPAACWPASRRPDASGCESIRRRMSFYSDCNSIYDGCINPCSLNTTKGSNA